MQATTFQVPFLAGEDGRLATYGMTVDNTACPRVRTTEQTGRRCHIARRQSTTNNRTANVFALQFRSLYDVYSYFATIGTIVLKTLTLRTAEMMVITYDECTNAQLFLQHLLHELACRQRRHGAIER